MPSPIQKTSVSQQVVDYVLNCIDQGDLKQGDCLPGEREFAESLGISRVPLREGISALAAIGIVDKRHGEGNFIAQFSPEILSRILRTYTRLDHNLADDLFEARSLVEGAAARLAARNATPEDIGELHRMVEQMKEDVRAYVQGEKTLAYMLQQDDKFHLQCAAASHNEFYIQFVGILHDFGTNAGLYEQTYGQNPEKYYVSLDFHSRLVSAIESKNEHEAQEIMCSHIESIRFNTEHR
ncbi:MAG: FCD domain-containing protein [Oscillospiraceae bacterium]|nr:FCD domain-containing protein [Oscillospiraceae bacterium]